METVAIRVWTILNTFLDSISQWTVFPHFRSPFRCTKQQYSLLKCSLFTFSRNTWCRSTQSSCSGVLPRYPTTRISLHFCRSMRHELFLLFCRIDVHRTDGHFTMVSDLLIIFWNLCSYSYWTELKIESALHWLKWHRLDWSIDSARCWMIDRARS